MKSFIAGIITVVVLGIIGFYTFQATSSFMRKLTPSPSPSPSLTPTATPSPTPKPTLESELPVVPTTKGGLPITTGKVKGVSSTTTKTSTTTQTTSHLILTLIKTSVCPISYTTEVKDITGPLTLRYELIKNTSFGITVWNKDGNELLQNTTYSGDYGFIKTIDKVDYMKVRVESKTCAENNDNWLKLTAER